MSTASRGRAFEHEVRKLFRDAGYSVTRGAGSKGELDVTGDGPMKVDLICTKTGRDVERTVFVVGIQCKLKAVRGGSIPKSNDAVDPAPAASRELPRRSE